MRLQEWCKKHPYQKKVLLTDEVANVNRLARLVNKEKLPIANLEGKRFVDVAKEMIIRESAEAGNCAPVHEIGQNVAALLVYRILMSNRENDRFSFVPYESLCLETAEEILRVMNVVRMGKKTDEFDRLLTEKEAQFEALIETYEKHLVAENLYDKVRMLQEAVEIGDTQKKQDGICYAILDYKEEALTFLERRFVQAITNEYVTIDTHALDANIEKQFCRSYGQMNEIQYVLEDMQKRKLPFGGVNILYPSEEYENMIQVALQERGIPYACVDGYKVSDNECSTLLFAVLDWALGDYNYELFQNVVDNRLIRMSKDYRIVRQFNLGWGLPRYEMLLDQMRNHRDDYLDLLEDHRMIKRKPEEDGTKTRIVCSEEFLKFVETLTDIFSKYEKDTTVSIFELYDKLYHFIREYAQIENFDKPYMNQLWSLRSFFEHAGNADSLQQALEFIRKYVEEISLADDEKSNAVTVMRMGRTAILERPYQYCLGMAYDTFEQKIADSPVISDRRLVELVDTKAGYVELSMKINDRKKSHLIQSMQTQREGMFTMIRCEYDTVNNREITASHVYSECLNQSAGSKELAVGYPNVCAVDKNYKIDKKKLFKDAAGYEETNPDIKAYYQSLHVREEQINGKRLVHLEHISPTDIQTLMDCQLKLEYKRRRMNTEKLEYEVWKWLPANYKGNLFHEVMEQYCNEKLKGVSVGAGTRPDYIRLEQIFDKKAAQFELLVPSGSGAAVQREKENYKKMVKDYVTHLYTELAGKWRVIACEKEFETAIRYMDETGNDFKPDMKTDSNGNQVPDLDRDAICYSYHGFIDRIDASEADLQVGVPPVCRIIDYKTGKKDSLVKKIEKNTQLQHLIYPNGVPEKVTNVQYDFPYDGIQTEVRNVSHGEDLPLTVRERIAKIFLKNAVEEESADACTYCDYKDVCVRRLQIAE